MYAISEESPMAKMMIGKKVGDEFVLNRIHQKLKKYFKGWNSEFISKKRFLNTSLYFYIYIPGFFIFVLYLEYFSIFAA